ncbi:PAS domain S-box-containing protein [Kitasatospora sp. SolWspMP-SS2h]|uniref:SpoIIE family protein phosphatase n=1 Tax=Kitasatospora sp. SolWspMP-SS2h TaxID=1305729 RepID=UPI000DBFBF18|nr:SpoIIE family protein phosphatase [Kitasatospora sp. SolWspMP-SS2h]RAJ44071.1 PAS domain S-box-containing protein [Kitasatospora sp. SolWspMP-SS2h]
MDSRRLPNIDGVAAALVDGDGRVVGWTAAAEHLLGLPAAQVTGRPVADLLADGAADAAALGRRTGEVRLRTGGGVPLEVAYQVLPLAGEHGEVRALVLATPADTVTRWRQDEAFTRELFLQDRIGLAFFDTDLRLLRTNTHLLPYTGLPTDLAGHRLGDFLQPQDAEATEEILRNVLTTGEPLVRATLPIRTLDDPGPGVMMEIQAFRLQAPDGSLIGVTALFGDVTELHRYRRRADVLHRATAAVGGSLSVAGTAEDLAGVLVPGLGTRAEVDIAEAVFTGDEPVAGADGLLRVRRTATAGPPGPDDRPLGPLGPLDRAELGRPAAAADGPPAMSAPLHARGGPLGRVTVRRDPEQGPYEAEDLELLREIAARAALALDNARRYTREHRAAVGLQRSLLPPAETAVPAATTASVYRPTDTATGVGGDWFDVIPLSGARVALVAGDVVGHGLQASATMGRLRTAVRTLADLDLEPDELLVHLDDLVSQLVVEGSEEERERGVADPSGATCVYAVYDPVSGICQAASAGHPPPALVHPDGRVEYLPVNPGPPLGVGGLPFETVECALRAGSVLALYTDGLIEGGTGGDLDEGMDQLAARLGEADLGGDLAAAGRAIVAEMSTAGLSDDVTLLLARLHPVPPSDTAAWTIGADPSAVAGVREAATRTLEEWGLDALVFTTELVLSELVTNAIRYAGGPVMVRLIRSSVLTCEVSDPSATQPRMRRARLTDEGGRGLYLVAQLTERWGSRYTRSGKTIWAEQPLDPPPFGG